MIVYKYIISSILLLLSMNLTWSQTVLNEKEGHASAIVDMSQQPNGKAFIPPKVTLQDLTNAVNPINNPAEGLIVYNIGNNQLKGYYVFENGEWSLLANRENSVSNVVLKNASVQTYNLNTSNYTNILLTNEIFNNTGGAISLNNNQITLAPGNYSIVVEINIETNESTTGAIGGTNAYTHSHFYSARLWNGNTTIGGISDANASSNTTGSKRHFASFTFTFSLTSTETLDFQLIRRAGGTYSGDIIIQDAFINIEKSL